MDAAMQIHLLITGKRLMQKNGWLSLGCVWVLSVQTAQAAITLDRTRAIYDGSSWSISLNVTNENKQQPYLA